MSGYTYINTGLTLTINEQVLRLGPLRLRSPKFLSLHLVSQVFVAAFYKRNKECPSNPQLLHGGGSRGEPNTDTIMSSDVGHSQYTTRFRYI